MFRCQQQRQLILTRIAAIGNDSALSGVRDELEEFAADCAELRLRRFFQGLLLIQSAPIEKFERAFDFVSFRGGEIGAAQAYDVDPVNLVLRCAQEWRKILGEPSFRHDQAAHPDALVKARSATDKRAIVDLHMAGQQTIVRDHHAISERAIVTEVSADHEKISIAQNSRAAFHASTMNRAVFANYVVLADLNRTLRF